MVADKGPAHGVRTAVLDVRGVQWASEKARVEAVLGRRPGVRSVEANPVAQTATVTYDPGGTSVRQLADWIRDCGYHSRGRSVPDHVCDPLGVLVEQAASSDRDTAERLQLVAGFLKYEAGNLLDRYEL